MARLLMTLALVCSVLLRALPAAAAESASSDYVPGFYGDFGMAFLPEPGTYFNNWLSYYPSTFDVSAPGLPVHLDYDSSTVVDAVGVIQVPKTPVLGGHFGCAAFMSLIYGEITETVHSPFGRQRNSEARLGLGDTYVVPAGLLWNVGDFNFLTYEGFILPTGTYNKNRLMNTGRNYWAFDSNVGFTWFDQEHGHEISSMIGFMANTKNDTTDYQSGDDFHLDYLVGQYFSERFGVGVTGSF